MTAPATQAPASPLKTAAAYAAVYLAWGSTYFAIRVGVSLGHFSPGGLCGLRFLLAGLLILGLRRFYGPLRWSAYDGGTVLRTLALGCVMLGGGTGFLSYAERTVPSGAAALVIGCSPMFFALFNRLAGGPALTRAQVIGGILGTLGVAALGSGDLGLGSGASILPGIGLQFLGMVCWTGASVAAKRLRLVADALLAAALQNFGAGALMLAFALARREFALSDLAGLDPRVWAAIIYLAAVGSLVGFTAYVWLLPREPSNRVSSYAFVNPVVAVVLGAAFLGERVTPSVAAAMALVVGGVSLSLFGSRPKPIPSGAV